MSDWGAHSNFRIPDTVPSLTPRSAGNQLLEGDNNSITGHEKFVLAINNIVQVPDGWQCHVCDTHIPGSDYEAWVHTYDDDHRRRRPPKPKRPADLPPCLDVRDYSGAMHCDSVVVVRVPPRAPADACKRKNPDYGERPSKRRPADVDTTAMDEDLMALGQFAAENAELLSCYDLGAKLEGHIRRHNDLIESLTRFAGFTDDIETHLFRAASARKALERASQEADVTKRAEAVAKVFDLLSRCGEGLAEVQKEVAPKAMRGRAKYLTDVVRTKAEKCRAAVAGIHADGLRALDDIQDCIAQSSTTPPAA
ncbi:hypothetical protein FOZ60_008214 [Perkinsus olseni]|uniref:Uncharacterized protein n=1 Tax=Perkinsus olseni TaxID=32597 RepID=A0A7J6NK95_PEROL|nr:hypothetical protein FOZ60_008214 [Perkinsus olseni]